MPINSSVRLCGSRCRQNKYALCTQPAMNNKKRCRMHGGKCTGPKTPEGKKRAAAANLKHGLHTNKAILERLKVRAMLKWRQDLS